MKGNFFICFIAVLIVTLFADGPVSVTDNAETGRFVIETVADSFPGTPFAGALNKFLGDIDKFKKATSLGEDSSAGHIAPVYHKVIADGSVGGMVARSLNKNLAKGQLGPTAVLLLGLAVTGLTYIFLGGILEVGRARFFLELRDGRKVRPSKVFHVYRIGKTRHVAFIVFLRMLYMFLWAFTIVGLPIKYYAYRLVPYIAAENPGISRKEVFALSSKLMKGQKFKLFLLDVTFLPLRALSLATFGILGYVWINPYYNASNAEVYAMVRGEALVLHDYENMRLPAKLEEAVSNIGAKPQYSFLNTAMMFIAFSFIGWVYECLLWIIQDGLFVNRGTMYGPWIPIYGVGGIVIITIVNRFYKRPMVCFFMTMAVCAPIEYVGAWVLWKTRHLKYWDYSGYFLNIQGRVCLEGILVFAILGSVGIYIVAPMLDTYLNRIPKRTRTVICAALFAVFLIDLCLSHIYPRTGPGITYDLQ